MKLCLASLCLFVVSALTTCPVLGQADTLDAKPKISYGDKGWHLETADGRFSTDAELRFQFRYSYPFEQDPVTLDDFSGQKEHILQIRRARMKIGGHAYTPKLKYYMEYELAASNLLDFWIMYQFHPAFRLHVGQYKARYNSERVISSGKQQTVERSILTRPFTIDRQTGLTLFGNFGEGVFNFSYWLSALNGTGRGGYVEDDHHLMYMARLQWNMFGREMKFSGSNLKMHESWQGYLASGFVTNQSAFTRFSQSGGGQLVGSVVGLPGQYRTYQYHVETAFKKNGFSWQQEYHWKRVDDTINDASREMLGNYLQLGSFPETYLSNFPKELELAVRYSFFVPVRGLSVDEEEYVVAANWFFSGHRNKLTAEVAYLEAEGNEAVHPGWRYRFQWDISF